MSKCYLKACKNDVDYQTTGSFFCCPEHKEEFNAGEPLPGSDKVKWTISQMQTRLRQRAKEAGDRARRGQQQLPTPASSWGLTGR